MKVVEMWAELRATDGLVFWAAAPAVWAARRTSAHTSDHTQSGKTERNRKNPPDWPETNNRLTSQRRERVRDGSAVSARAARSYGKTNSERSKRV